MALGSNKSLFVRLFSAFAIFLSVFNIKQCICQTTCLSNPPSVSHTTSPSNNEIQWTENDDGSYSTALSYDPVTFDKDIYELPCTFTTRVHNNSLPSPTLIIRPGNTYYITLINNFGLNSDDNSNREINTFRDPNTTNIHTHGLHISGESPSDSIFTIAEWNIVCYHYSGTFWYHPHHHGL